MAAGAPDPDLTGLAADAAQLVDEAVGTFATSPPEAIEREAFAAVYGLPWTMGDDRPAVRDVLVGALERREEPIAAELLGAVGALFPQAGVDGSSPLHITDAWAAAAGEAQCVALVVGIDEERALPAYVVLEREPGALGGGLRDAPRPVADVRREVEAFVGRLDAVTPLDPVAARERVRRLLQSAVEQDLPQRESFAMDRPLLARALDDDPRTWPVLPMVPDEDGAGGGAPAQTPRRQDGGRKRRDKRKQAKAARRRNRR